MDWWWIIGGRWYNGSFWSQKAEYYSVLLLFRILISFLLCRVTDSRSTMALLDIGRPDSHPTIYTATTICTECEALCIMRAGGSVSMVVSIFAVTRETYWRFFDYVHVVGQRSRRLLVLNLMIQGPLPVLVERRAHVATSGYFLVCTNQFTVKLVRI